MIKKFTLDFFFTAKALSSSLSIQPPFIRLKSLETPFDGNALFRTLTCNVCIDLSLPKPAVSKPAASEPETSNHEVSKFPVSEFDTGANAEKTTAPVDTSVSESSLDRTALNDS